MFTGLVKGSLILAPVLIHGGRRDKQPTLFYVKKIVDNVSQEVITVDGKEYNLNGRPLGFHSHYLKPFIHTEDETGRMNQYLQSIKLRNIVRDNLLDDDVVDKLTDDQLRRILNIIDTKSRYYRCQ